MIDRRALIGFGTAALLGALRDARAQYQPGPPTPGVVQAAIAEPAPSAEIADRISPAARGKSLMVVNKLSLTVGIYDAADGSTQTSFSLPSRPHELLIARDRRRAYVSIYGDGIYGQNPHPGTQVAVIDLARREPVDFLSTRDVFAPHGLAEGPDGTIWTTCDIGAAVVGFDPRSGERIAVVASGGKGGHWMVADAWGKAYLSNRAGPGIPVLDLVARRLAGTVSTPNAVTGLDLSPDGSRLYAADDRVPSLLTIDTASGRILSTTPLEGLPRPTAKGGDRERRIKASPDGRFVFISDFPSAAVVRIDAADPTRQKLLLVQHGPMSLAFSPDGKTAWVCNHDAGTITVVDVDTLTALGDFGVGQGPETAALLT
jgi:YVTN family beta-propeller protein